MKMCSARWAGGLLALLAVFSANAQPAARSPSALEEDHKVSTLSVTGTGEVKARPDHALVRLGVIAEAEEAAAAQQSVNAALRQTLEQLRKLGISERSLQTARLQLSPLHAQRKPGRESDEPRIVGYRASNTLQVQVNELELVGKVIDAGMRSGVNRLEGISFGLEDDLPFRLRALKLAAEEARAKAQALADALEVRLLTLRATQAEGVQRRPPAMMHMMAMETQRMADTPVEPGELTVSASVTVHYEIAPRFASPTGRRFEER